EFRGLDMQRGMQFQQRFVDAAQFFGAKVLVVHHAPAVPVVAEGQRAYGIEQVAVGDLAVREIRYRPAREEKAVQRGQAKFATTIVAAQRLHYQPQPGEEVGVARADALFRQPPQSRRRVVRAVALALDLASSRMK